MKNFSHLRNGNKQFLEVVLKYVTWRDFLLYTFLNFKQLWYFTWTWLHKWIENFKVAFDNVKKYSRYIFRKVFKKYFHNVKIAARKLYLRECSYNEETS